MFEIIVPWAQVRDGVWVKQHSDTSKLLYPLASFDCGHGNPFKYSGWGMTWVVPREDWVNDSIPDVSCICRWEKTKIVIDLCSAPSGHLYGVQMENVGWHHVRQSLSKAWGDSRRTYKLLPWASHGLVEKTRCMRTFRHLPSAITWRRGCGATAGVSTDS